MSNASLSQSIPFTWNSSIIPEGCDEFAAYDDTHIRVDLTKDITIGVFAFAGILSVSISFNGVDFISIGYASYLQNCGINSNLSSSYLIQTYLQQCNNAINTQYPIVNMILHIGRWIPHEANANNLTIVNGNQVIFPTYITCDFVNYTCYEQSTGTTTPSSSFRQAYVAKFLILTCLLYLRIIE